MAKRRNPKTEALRLHGTLNLHPERVRESLFLENDFFDPEDLLQVKYEMLRTAQSDGQAVAHAAAAFGFSRPSFYQARQAFERDGLAGLVPQRRGPRQAHKLTPRIMARIEEIRQRDPSVGVMDLVHIVGEQFGVRVHRRTMERALARQQKKGR